MLFPTFTFAVFFLIVFAGNVALRRHGNLWRPFLIASSYFFYGWWNAKFCLLLAASTLLNWLVAQQISRRRGSHRRSWVRTAVVANLMLLGLFKYYDFFVVSTENLTGGAVRLPILELVLPVGISFFTFQAISYVVDVGRKDSPPIGFVDFALYLSFFPQLVAGPIVRVSEFATGLRQERNSEIRVADAFWLIGRGLFKKVVIASYLSTHVVDPAFGAPGAASREELIVGFYGYAVQIYADFSGYTDIAIGVALLLGFTFPTNFDRPYSALSVREFWRRWHITLSRWLRDYLYIPLGAAGATDWLPTATS